MAAAAAKVVGTVLGKEEIVSGLQEAKNAWQSSKSSSSYSKSDFRKSATLLVSNTFQTLDITSSLQFTLQGDEHLISGDTGIFYYIVNR